MIGLVKNICDLLLVLQDWCVACVVDLVKLISLYSDLNSEHQLLQSYQST